MGGAQQPTASGWTTRSSKRVRTEAESSIEKQPKQPKQAASKPRKAAVPRIKVPVASTYVSLQFPRFCYLDSADCRVSLTIAATRLQRRWRTRTFTTRTKGTLMQQMLSLLKVFSCQLAFDVQNISD